MIWFAVFEASLSSSLFDDEADNYLLLSMQL